MAVTSMSLLLIFFAINGRVVNYDMEDKLLNLLKSNLTKYSPPSGLFNDTVYVAVELIKILNLDQKMEAIVLTLMTTVTYYVPRLSWNPEGFGGLDYLTLPPGVVWTTDIGKFKEQKASKLS